MFVGPFSLFFIWSLHYLMTYRIQSRQRF